MIEALQGGNQTPGVVRIGDTVRRPRGRHSIFAAQAVQALNSIGFPWAPEYLCVDEEDRDVFAFVEGVTTDHPLQRDERCYSTVGEILKQLHDMTRGAPIADGGVCLVHGDPGPFNVVTREGMPVALIDWDSAHPGDPTEDLGYAAWTWCIQSTGNVPIADQARRLRRFRDGYDPELAGADLLVAILQQQDGIIRTESTNAQDDTLSDSRREHARAAIAWAQADQNLTVDNEATFARSLQ